MVWGSITIILTLINTFIWTAPMVNTATPSSTHSAKNVFSLTRIVPLMVEVQLNSNDLWLVAFIPEVQV